ncbi:hypothetical protein DV738_g193, partial [Chaetothyriales sp. CBS 135597]
MLSSLFPRARTVRVPVDNEQVAIRQVQVTNRVRPIVGRFIFTVLITYCVATTLSALASDDFKKRPGEQGGGQVDGARKPSGSPRSDHWKRQHDALSRTRPAAAEPEDSPIMHLTLPVWFRERRARMQTPQDREWQDFKQLMEDEQQVVEVQKKAAHVVLQLCHNRSDLKPWLRWIEYTGRTGVNFDIAPHIFSPPVYEVPCVIIKPSQVELGWRALSPAAGARIERIFHPAVFASALYAGMRAFASKSLAITAARVNKALSAPKDLLRAHLARAQSMTYTEALTAARQVFAAVWVRKQSSAMQTRTPGLCMMKGSITLEGNKGRIRLDVTAFYSPSTKSLIGLPVITSYLIIPDTDSWDTATTGPRQAARALSSLPAKEQHPIIALSFLPFISLTILQSISSNPDAMLATASLALYFVLNLLVTLSNKAIIQATACPYLLTVSHATATFLSTSILQAASPRPHHRPQPSGRTFRRRLVLALFSGLFALNITLSNFSLGLVSLPTYLSLLPIVFGVVVAATPAPATGAPYSAPPGNPMFGIWMTLLGAVTAVLKTIATHSLQADLAIPSYELIHITAPLAAVQGLFAACFQANKLCGPLTMGVAANIKQIAVLFVPELSSTSTSTIALPPRNVLIGSLATVMGGLWYAVIQARY